jgi:uncharacterized protein (TIGR02996 family)
MPTRDSPDAFYLALDESPGDPVTTLALADWYEEQGNSRAADCLRWAAENARWPFQYRKGGPVKVFSQKFHEGWYWWAVADSSADLDWGAEADWGHPRECRLPRPTWERLKYISPGYQPSVFKEYPSRRAAYEALFDAWLRRRR